MFTIIEHKSSSYAPRTYVNASSAQLTVAIASDFNTAGERLTKKAAGGNYLHLNINIPAIENARKLYSVMKRYNINTLNIAGNGIYTLSKCGFTQEGVNYYVYEILALVTNHLKVDRVVSGIQSGVDLAGAGLHAGSLEYAKGWSRGHVMKVKINPRNVVSVPYDCSMQKMRTCGYEVIGEVYQ